MMLSIWVLSAGAGLAYTPEGKLEVLVPGHDAKITFQEIDDNKVLASVLDAEENPVKDLMTEDFKVIKGGIDAIVINAEILKSRKDVPINYVLMVDNSFSMKERNAVEPLLAALDEFLKIVRPIDEVQVVVFDNTQNFQVDGHNLRLAVFKSDNIKGLQSFFQRSFKEGMSKQTFLYEGILGGLDLVSKLPEKNNKFLVVFSDGEDLNSDIKKDIIAPKAKGLKNFRAFSIDFMPTVEKDAFLNAFAEAAGGKCWKATSAANLLPIFQEVSTALLYQYVVEYTFVNPPQGNLVVYPSDVTIEELTIIDSSPLLNYIFFEAGQSTLPEHYHLLKTQAEAGGFDEKMLQDTMTKYYDVLNIIGKRLVENPEANVELVGCVSDKGEEKNNLTLSRARAESVKSYLQYIWNIDPGRLIVTARKLPEIPSTSRVQEGVVENQRVEIRSGSPAILDSIKSTYTFEVADSNEITIQPNIKPGYDLKEWKIWVKGDETLLKSIEGQGNMIPDASFNLVEYGLSKIGAFKTLSTGATLTDITGQTFETDVFKTNIKYITRVESKAQKLEYKVVEKYALILFDFDSSDIKERNKTVIDRVTARIKELPDASVTILGQTDIIGTEDYNVALSIRRAQSVYQTVMDSGISSPERVTSKGNGPHDPPYNNASPEGRSFNRTVIITIEYETTD
jgi:outer membrane protein OmpA-like peptidoglycan-associated protein